MCLILLAYRAHPRYPMVFAANRDEFYGRPTRQAHFWEDAPHVLAGKDEEAGGTWCGVTRSGRLAAVTNYREAPSDGDSARSRGELVADYLRGDEAPSRYIERVARKAHAYRGFNLLVADPQRLFYFSNREGEIRELTPAIYGLSNHLLDTPWFKVRQGREMLDELVRRDDVTGEALFEVLASEARAEDPDLPATGFGRQWERVLSPAFIRTEEYGTRCSTVILIDDDGQIEFRERTFDAAGMSGGEQVIIV